MTQADVMKRTIELMKASIAARKVNEKRLTRFNRVHVELGIAAYPELDLEEQIRNEAEMGSASEKLVSLLEQAEKLGRDEMEKRSRKPTPSTEDKTPIPEKAWKVAGEKYRKYKGTDSV